MDPSTARQKVCKKDQTHRKEIKTSRSAQRTALQWLEEARNPKK